MSTLQHIGMLLAVLSGLAVMTFLFLGLAGVAFGALTKRKKARDLEESIERSDRSVRCSRAREAYGRRSA